VDALEITLAVEVGYRSDEAYGLVAVLGEAGLHVAGEVVAWDEPHDFALGVFLEVAADAALGSARFSRAAWGLDFGDAVARFGERIVELEGGVGDEWGRVPEHPQKAWVVFAEISVTDDVATSEVAPDGGLGLEAS